MFNSPPILISAFLVATILLPFIFVSLPLIKIRLLFISIFDEVLVVISVILVYFLLLNSSLFLSANDVMLISSPAIMLISPVVVVIFAA